MMTASVAPYLYTEARLNIEPTYHNSILQISTEPTGLFGSRKRARADDGDGDQDEEAYAKRHLATESSIFFRRRTRSPRAFVWRILDDGRQLELQCVDLVQGRRNTHESVLSFRLQFAHAIRANGVAFADPDQHDALDVFVLTTANELFTFALSKADLLRATVPVSSAEWDPKACWKCFKPASFSFKFPYRLVSASSLELFVSLHDGGILRLNRKPGDNGSSWRETFFTEGGWGSTFRGLIPFRGHNTVRFADADLEPTTAAAIALSPDNSHLFTVSLDHTLKAWNMNTGKIAVQTDLLGENHKDQHAGSQYLMNPNQGSIMQIVEVDGRPDGDMYYVVTNSPKDHQFKFWAIRDADSVAHGIRDLQSEVKLIPPLDELMNTNVWQLVEFHLKPGHGWQKTQLWIRVRAGTIVKLFTLNFDLLVTAEELEDVWQNNWAAVDEGSLTPEALMENPQYPHEVDKPLSEDPTTPTERWLDFLFYPGRFSPATLESALFVYRKGHNLLSGSARSTSEKSLKDRLCGAIAAKVGLSKTQSGQVDYERYQSDVAAQWHIYFGLVKLLHGRRAESLSLAYDHDSELPWSVRADFVSPIRTCSEIEIMRLNQDIFTTQDEHVIVNSIPLADSLRDDNCVLIARLLAGAREFRRGLSSYFQSAFEQASTASALQLDSNAAPNGIADKHNEDLQQLYDACALGSEVTDDDFNTLTESMQSLGGLGELDNATFYAAMERLSEAEHGVEREDALTRYGDKMTIRGAQETLQCTQEIILDLLALVVFMAGDLEPDELHPEFDASELYEQLMSKLKEHKVLLWLASNVRQEPSRRTKVVEEVPGSPKRMVQPALTVFESIFIGDWQSLRFPDQPLPSLITYWSRTWTYGANLTTAYNGVVMHIMGNLIKHSNLDLAADFERFLPHGPWAQYLRGRLYLAVGDCALAGECFKGSADDLSRKGVKVDALDTCGLLNLAEKPYLADGRPRYYMHVASLYEGLKLHTYTADFASLALDELASTFDDQALSNLDARKQGMHGSPAAVKIDMSLEELRLLKAQQQKEDILLRIFSASLQTFRYRKAFDALMDFGNPTLRKASLHSLLQSLIQRQDTQTLLSLPFPASLTSEIDAILLTLCKKYLPFSPHPTPSETSTTTSSKTTTTTTTTSSSAAATSMFSMRASPPPAAQPQYHHVLYTWRVQHGDFRGAAEILWDRLQRLRDVEAEVFMPDDETVLEAYLVLINTLACLGKEDGWILAEAGAVTAANGARGGGAGNAGRKKRRIVTLEEIRKEYQGELDRRSDMLHGRFPLLMGGASGTGVAAGASGDVMDML